LHGALLDAEILAEVFLLMTGGQASLLDDNLTLNEEKNQPAIRLSADRPPLKIITCSAEELQTHQQRLAQISKVSGHTVWEKYAE
jgi:DNA polymerase-3 subunit epsilon